MAFYILSGSADERRLFLAAVCTFSMQQSALVCVVACHKVGIAELPSEWWALRLDLADKSFVESLRHSLSSKTCCCTLVVCASAW